MNQSHIISQVCQILRKTDPIDIGLLLQGLEFIQNVADLNIISIRMGIKNGFEAADDFTKSFKSGGTLDQITSAQQNRSVKKADKVKTQEALITPTNHSYNLATFVKSQQKMIQDYTFKANNPTTTTITTKPIIITEDSPTIIQMETPIVVAVTPTTTQINDATFPLGGRLSKFHNQWKEFGVSALILD